VSADVAERETTSSRDSGRHAPWIVGAVAAFGVALIVASATVPRWWAQRIGDQVDGSITQGTMLGLAYGFVFTLLPIAAIFVILRWRRTWKTIVVALAIGVVLALPNLMTLGIVIGKGNAAHAGDRTLDVEAPGFRGATLAGVLLAVAAVSFIWYLLASRRRARDELRRHKEQAKAADLGETFDAPVGDRHAQDADPEQGNSP